MVYIIIKKKNIFLVFFIYIYSAKASLIKHDSPIITCTSSNNKKSKSNNSKTKEACSQS